jgi:hypothetical protein
MAAAADVQKKVDALKKAGKKTALLLVATAEGDMLFVALPIEWSRHPSKCQGRPRGRPSLFFWSAYS